MHDVRELASETDAAGRQRVIVRGPAPDDPLAMMVSHGCGAWQGMGPCNEPPIILLQGRLRLHYLAARAYAVVREGVGRRCYAVVCARHATGEGALMRDMPGPVFVQQMAEYRKHRTAMHQIGPDAIRAAPLPPPYAPTEGDAE
jgi:hypothetical protein